MVVDRHDTRDFLRIGELLDQRLAEAAGRTGDRDSGELGRSATLSANAALMANLPSGVSQNRLLPNSVAIMTLLSCPTK
jgi:hypothetical protein